MASEKVVRILRSMGAPFSEEELRTLPEGEAWDWIYGNRPSSTKKLNVLKEICFTGYTDTDKSIYEQLAREHGLRPVRSVTKDLSYLCTGNNAGPVKIKNATERGAEIISTEYFMKMIGVDI